MASTTPGPTAGRDTSPERWREDRRRLEAAQDRYDTLAAEADRRQAGLEAHADTLASRDELVEAVATRRRELGVAVAIAQPDHVVDLIGAVPSHNPAALQRCTKMAGRIEAYREEWGVAPEQLRERPLDACQARNWDVAVQTSEMLVRPPGARCGTEPRPRDRPGVVIFTDFITFAAPGWWLLRQGGFVPGPGCCRRTEPPASAHQLPA